MKIIFGALEFCIDEENSVFLTRCFSFENGKQRFVEVQLAGENKYPCLGAKMVNSSEGNRLRYVSHTQTADRLEIVQRSPLIQVRTVLTGYNDGNAVRAYTEVKNISDSTQVLEEVSAFVCGGFGINGIDSAKDLYFTRFTQSHHAECQPVSNSFAGLGLYRIKEESQKRIAFANVGSWSTKEELPQGIIEDRTQNAFLMFQIERNHSWYYEIADKQGKYYLYLGGANYPFGGWCKKLVQNESYCTPSVALAFGNSFNEVLGEMTKYRRHIAGECAVDKYLPAVFNEYMHLSWDSPTEENTKKIAPIVAKTGVEYYVIDCGWHDEVDGNIIYPYVGQWKESKARFPHGVKATTDYIRSLGMKAGLWIEPEIIGINCQNMLDYYDDDCFLQRHGKRLCVNRRYFLDFRAKKVIDYMSETIRRMVEDYGAEYIKFDYNQDCGVGTDWCADSAGEGLEQATRAYLKWVDDIRKQFPSVLFETCSSGGMRMDYETLSHFSIVSTSDQTNYLKYPYMAGNILSAVLPEQAAVWSYPVDNRDKPISDEQVIINMVNCLLGRIHLASDLSLLSERQFALVKEGVEYYKTLSAVKKRALPYFPNGFAKFGEETVVAGLVKDKDVYLCVWNLSSNPKTSVSLDKKIERAEILYPKASEAKISFIKNELQIGFPVAPNAVLLKIMCL